MTSSPAPVPSLTPVLDFLRVLWQLNHRLEVASVEMLRTRGVTGQQRMLLRVVQHLQPVSAGVVANALHVHAGTLSASLRRLEERGLLVREKRDSDARRVSISLTPAGIEVANQLGGTIEEAVATVLQSTSTETTEAVLALLRELSAQMPARGDR